MSASERQNRLLVAEDWKRIYQSFRNADFKSYDFDNLRRTMINYLRQNYPEDFNDYIESSEYLALVDMIAFLGQNLSFRVDLNARENFLETAERRESILKLAKMLSYNPSRNQPANGLLKMTTVKTTESIRDSAGSNLSGVVVRWNDQSNANFFEQFIKILNAALPVTNAVGSALKSENIEGVQTQKYRFNATNTGLPVFPFSKNIEGVGTRFEVVSTDFNDGSIIEEPPLPGTSPAFLFRDDGQGAGSNNTGFFMHFRQGKLDDGTFNVSNPIPNQVVTIDSENINDTDVWLYSVDTNGFETNMWSKLNNVNGNNIIYNSLFQGNKNVYAVSTRINDRINLVFSDGVFGNLPSGNFKVYYRTSANRSSIITPSSIGLVSIEIPYQSKSGSIETLTLGFRLNYTVSNSSPSETNSSIKKNAPATYYTQNRLITGEDYNIGPLSISQEIVKTTSVNRTSSGISRQYDLKDPSGKYSNVEVYASDGVIYKEKFDTKTKFTFTTESDIEGVIYNTVNKIIADEKISNFYYSEFPDISLRDLNVSWKLKSTDLSSSSGFLNNVNDTPYTLGSYTNTNLKFVERGSMLKFVPPITDSGEKQYFLPNNTYTTNSKDKGASEYKWTKVVSVSGDGTKETDRKGSVIVLDPVPDGAVLVQVMPVLSKTMSDDLKVQIIDQTFAYKDYALRYDVDDRAWKLVLSADINTISEFASGKSGDKTKQNLDASWLLYFKTNGKSYTITYRNLRYVFESKDEVKFYFDKLNKVFDPIKGKVFKDRISVLSINTVPDGNTSFNKDYHWKISNSYKDAYGYVDPSKVEVQFIDYDNNSSIDNLDTFKDIVNPAENSINKIIFQEKYTTYDGIEDYRYFSNNNNEIKIVNKESEIVYSKELDGQIFYLYDNNIFKRLNKEQNNTQLETRYRAFVGRSDLKFQYVHIADSSHRINPSSSNIIDVYLLTKSYDDQMRKYIKGEVATQPKPQSSDSLYRTYSSKLNNIKSISDEVIYHPVKYKLLFGTKSERELQVTFKIVRNKEIVVNENELKADIIKNIERFFATENWDFGETFYFQELSAYIMNQMSPKLLSVVIVPKQGNQVFGSLFQIKSEPDEIFISSATVSDIEVIDEITATELQASGDVITSSSTANYGILSTSRKSIVNGRET